MDILSEISGALRAHDRVVLATIVSSSGSSPLPTGSSLLVCERGMHVVGTVGGGSLEANVTEEAKKQFAHSRESALKAFELNEPGLEDGMICGGTVEVLIERIGEDALPIFSRLADVCNAGNDCTLLRLVSQSGRVTRLGLEDTSEQVITLHPIAELLKQSEIDGRGFVQKLQRSHREESVGRIPARECELIIHPIVGIQPLIICGGGHVGRCLSKVAAATGFTVTIIDDRDEYATPNRFPEAHRTISRTWERAFSDLDIKSSTSIVIVTHGHESDKQVLRLAIETPARYIGMIGSGRKVAATFDSLHKEGILLEALKRVHAPIGLDIGAVTAEEIAVSIVAELVRERRHFRGASTPLSEKINQRFTRGE